LQVNTLKQKKPEAIFSVENQPSRSSFLIYLIMIMIFCWNRG